MGITLKNNKSLIKILPNKIDIPTTPYIRPTDWLQIPEFDTKNKDEIYILNGVGLNCLNKIYFRITTSQNATIDWGDGQTTEITTASRTTYSHEYNYTDLPDNSYTEHNQTKQALIHISTVRGAITYFSTGDIAYQYTNADGITVNYSSDISTNVYEIDANVKESEVYCSGASYSRNKNLEIFDWKGNIINTNMSSMFSNCYSLQSIPQLNTSSVTNMSSMFSNCYSLQSIPQLNTSSVTNMGSMFSNCYSLQSIPQLNTSSVTNMSYMFSSCYSLQSIPQLNTSSVTDMSSMFSSCYSLQSIPQLNTSSVTDMSSMFSSCYSLQSIPQLNTSSVTNMGSMFSSCYSLQSIPQLNTSSVTNMRYMFSSCYSLQSIPQLNTSSVTNMGSMFSSCYSLQSIPQLNTSSVTNMGSMFSNCYSLQSIPQLNTSSVTNMGSMFSSCYSLQSIPQLNTSSVTDMSSMFYNCYSLLNLKPYGAGDNTQTSITLSNLLYSRMLTKQALVDLFNSLAINSNLTRILQLGSTIQGYLSSCYVKDSSTLYQAILPTSDTEVDTTKTYYTYNAITGEYTQFTGSTFDTGTFYYELKIASWNKYNICESTDEGAMLALDFVRNIKKWTVS